MSDGAISTVMGRLLGDMDGLFAFLSDSAWARNGRLPSANDFVVGNPQEMPIPGIADALVKAVEPRDKDWFAYKLSEDEARDTVAETLSESHGMPFRREHVFMTNGAFGGIALALRAVVDPGDEVVFMRPPWFFYHPIIVASGAVPVPVQVRPDDFDLDLEAIEAALTERTRAVIVNSPNNPTGRIYPAETLARLGELLRAASERAGRSIYLVSDESYSRIVFEGRFESPVRHYERSLLVYTYGKTLLAPGLRLGYIALPPNAPDQELLGGALMMATTTMGWAFPVSLLQQALPELQTMSIDVEHLRRKRDRVVEGLRSAGYELHVPEGTFYLLPRSPIPDDWAFTDRLAERETYVLPGSLISLPGYFRLSLTANDEMIERALPIFADAAS